MQTGFQTFLFAIFGMAVVFGLTGLLTFAIWVMGFIMRWSAGLATKHQAALHAKADDGIPAEHLAAMALAIELYRAPGERGVALLQPRRTYSWEKKTRVESPRGHVSVLRRTR